MKRILACLIVLVSVLAAPPATGQTTVGRWSPGDARAVESNGHVMLTFTRMEPGRTVYYTRDACNRPGGMDESANGPITPSDCESPAASASEDYVPVKGEWIFTEPGSKTITIPIIDDDRDEADKETFVVIAAQHDDVAGQIGWYGAWVSIADDDPRDGSNQTDRGDPTDDGGAATVVNTSNQRDRGDATDGSDAATVVNTTVVTRAEPRPDGSPAVDAPPSPLDLEVALPSDELEPGPGFELAINGEPQPASERDRQGVPWLALALGTTVVGSSGVMWIRGRRRWSPTRS